MCKFKKSRICISESDILSMWVYKLHIKYGNARICVSYTVPKTMKRFEVLSYFVLTQSRPVKCLRNIATQLNYRNV